MTVPLVFATPAGTLDASVRGGVQICTDEFVRTFRAAGYDVRPATVDVDRRLRSRIHRRLRPQPYAMSWPAHTAAAIAATAAGCGAEIVCLNLVNLAPLAPALRAELPPACRIVLLSHGLESVDYLHVVSRAEWSSRHERELGRRLLQERAQRSAIDHVFCLTPFEAEIERWLGAASVAVVPRTPLDIAPLDWHPEGRRLGFVGTIDHPPTRDGLVALLDAMTAVAPAGLQVRIVGGPERVGRELASRFGIVRYLGVLGDDALRQEAASWSAFVHPMFCMARGCSTKVAVALAWQIPIVTTPAGLRGYTWQRGDLPAADTPAALAQLACWTTDPVAARRTRDAVIQVARTMPSVAQVGALIREALQPAGAVRRERPA